MFKNELPGSFVNCTSLSRFRIQNNLVNGTISYCFGPLKNLTFVERLNFTADDVQSGDATRRDHGGEEVVWHRNIVGLLGCCSNRECTMLLHEYMPNGNLDNLLHEKNKGENLVADWVTRYKITLVVAQGSCHLHHDCDPVIVHCGLKPSNILLDSEMEARWADFRVAKLIQSDD
ncbi:hypothetical protein F3Y22_tig00110020pilonHSYRG00532 [Hibiscus syriacus]|uniref:Protein kinase domain-containing protein n=1 Tax=Hibiscus syriacus TaxID=106335 RepID=A0A6A3BRL7_HIBSY|nr:hypothetical protein F3Y22_tig00110020pilonHSYRG00532 [Hibiscus syriacus]